MNLPSGPAGKLLFLVFVLAFAGCAATPPSRPADLRSALTFEADYDRVWAAALDVLDQRGFVIAQMAKEDGYITTDIKQMGGWLRGKLSLRLVREDGLVRVTVNSYTEELESRDGLKDDIIYYWDESGRYRYLEDKVLKEIDSRL